MTDIDRKAILEKKLEIELKISAHMDKLRTKIKSIRECECPEDDYNRFILEFINEFKEKMQVCQKLYIRPYIAEVNKIKNNKKEFFLTSFYFQKETPIIVNFQNDKNILTNAGDYDNSDLFKKENRENLNMENFNVLL